MYDDLAIFCTVVACGSFKQAAQQLNLPHSTVSRRVSRLETQLQQTLISRTTRQIRITPLGMQVYQHSAPLLQQLKHTLNSTLDSEQVMEGRLCVTMPVRIGLNFLAKWLIEFAAEHPALQLDIQLNNAQLDLLAHDIDLAFRIGPLADSSAIATRLWSIAYCLVAQQQWVQQQGIAADAFALTQLESLPCIIAKPQQQWLFNAVTGHEIRVNPCAALHVNDLSLALYAAQQGLGIAYVPQLMVERVSGQASLVQLFAPDWQPLRRVMYAFYQGSRHPSPRIQRLVAYIRQRYVREFGDTA